MPNYREILDFHQASIIVFSVDRSIGVRLGDYELFKIALTENVCLVIIFRTFNN